MYCRELILPLKGDPSANGEGCDCLTSSVLRTPPSKGEFVLCFVKSIYTSCYTFLHYELGRIVNSFSL